MLGQYLGAGSTVTQGLYHLLGNSSDSSGNARNGTDTSMTYGDGGIFNGTSSRIQLPYTVADNQTAITVSAWVLRNVTGAQHTVIAKLTSGVSDRLQLLIEGVGGVGNDKIRWRVNDQTLASNQTIAANAWYHIVGVSTGSGMLLYVNGVLDNSNATAVTMPSATDAVFIGCVGGFAAFMNGRIKEVIVENRVRSATEVQKQYTYQKGRFGIF